MSNEAMELPEIDIDISGDEYTAFGGDGGAPKLPVGDYTMDIVDVKSHTSKKGGAGLKITFRVADEGEFQNVEVSNIYSLATKPSKEGGTPAIGRYKQLALAAGARLDKIRPAELIGARVIVGIVHREGEPKHDAQGNVQPGGWFANVVNERAIAVEEAEPPPPPPAAKVQTQAKPQANKNGSPAARRA